MNIEEIDSNFPNVQDNTFCNNTDSPKILLKYFDNSLEDNLYDNNYIDYLYIPLRTEVGLTPYNSLDSSTNMQSSAVKQDKNQEIQKNNEINSSPSKLFNEEIQISKDESNISNKIKIKKTIFGRPQKDNPRKGKHTRKSKDNGIKVLITSCSRSIHNSLQKEIKTFIGKKRGNDGKIIKSQLHVPTITKKSSE